MTEYGKTVKKRLIELDKSQKWLVEEVSKETGRYFDSPYLAKICNGSKLSPKITEAISKILQI